jgi:hypothetical protein
MDLALDGDDFATISQEWEQLRTEIADTITEIAKQGV